MFKQFILVAAVLSALAGCSGGEAPAGQAMLAQAAPIGPATLAQIDAYVGDQMAHQHLPGLSVVIAKDGKTVFEKGYGLANIGSNSAASAQTVYRIGSISKQFCASALMLLVQDGKLALDEPYSKYFPTVAANWKTITVRQLMQHTAGLQRDFGDDFLTVYDPARSYTPDELVALTAYISPAAAPGQVFSYSNVGYYMLGLLVERVSGQHYIDFLRGRIFQPLDMRSADLITTAATAPLLAAGYTWADGKWVRDDALWPGAEGAYGNLQMSAQDLAKWDAALYGEQILTAASRAQMWAPAVLNDGSHVNYGLGWGLGTVNGHPFTSHNGEVSGFHAQIERHTGEGWTVIVLSNQTDGAPEQIGARLASLVDPELTWQFVSDTHPEVTALAHGAIDDVVAGRFTAQRYTAEAADWLASGPYQAYVDGAASFGTIEQFGLNDVTTQDGVPVYRYLIKSKYNTAFLILQVDAGGKISAMTLMPV